MIGTVPYTKPGEDDIIWWPETFFDSDSIADDPGVMGVYPGGDFRPGICRSYPMMRVIRRILV